MSIIVFRNAAILDAQSAHRREGCDVVVENDTIREVAERPVNLSGAAIIDIGGRTLMPGLIDCHVHVVATMLNLGANAAQPNAIITLKSVPVLRGMLDRTQFILITHNRQTMEIANRLYGVTMEEPGVSKLISVQLN